MAIVSKADEKMLNTLSSKAKAVKLGTKLAQIEGAGGITVIKHTVTAAEVAAGTKVEIPITSEVIPIYAYRAVKADGSCKAPVVLGVTTKSGGSKVVTCGFAALAKDDTVILSYVGDTE